MKVERTIHIDTNTFEIGDIINVKFVDDTELQAMAVKCEKDGTIFCSVDCIPGEYKMNKSFTNKGGYEHSDLRKKLNSEILGLFPTEFKSMMIPFENGDLLRIPTEKEIFGVNKSGECEDDNVEQWIPMKERRNRIAFNDKNHEDFRWYWLMNKVKNSQYYFVHTHYWGVDGDLLVNYERGIRPVFKLKNQ